MKDHRGRWSGALVALSAYLSTASVHQSRSRLYRHVSIFQQSLTVAQIIVDTVFSCATFESWQRTTAKPEPERQNDHRLPSRRR